MNKRFLCAVLIVFLIHNSLPVPAMDTDRDTTFRFSFEVNMSKMVKTGLFDPDSDRVYVKFEEAVPDLELARGIHDVFSGILFSGLDSGVLYHFRFRINDTAYETVNRTATANPGTTEISAWWNDDPLNITRFRVDMTYMMNQGLFNPAADTVDMTGTMNDWLGSDDMIRTDTTWVYETTYWLNPGETYQYKFRIRHDSVRIEELGGINRFFRAPDTIITILDWFGNLNPATVPVTFDCRMNYMMSSGQFDPAVDFLDLAGNFNGWGDYTLLYPTGYDTIAGSDSLFRVTVFPDTSLVGGAPLEFKFRINGSWELAELKGKDPRTYSLIDTVTQYYYFCWYDNLDPSVPTPPWVTGVEIQGHRVGGAILTGMYNYHNLNGIPEGVSLYKWYRADSVGGALTPIDSAWAINYTADTAADVGKHLVFEVTPVAASGDSATGSPVLVYTTTPIGSVGIHDLSVPWLKIYPNPVSDLLVCSSRYPADRVEIYSVTGTLQIRSTPSENTRIVTDVSRLAPGLYLFRLITSDGKAGQIRFLKL